MSEWFKEWFNTNEYQEVYQHRNEADAKQLFNLIMNNVEIVKNGKVLDLACGAGRHSILFAKKGFDVTAVDLSENLLKTGKFAAEREKVKVRFIEADLRYFEYHEKFDLVLNLFTSFGYFEKDEENYEIFRLAAEHLKTGGYFMLDFTNRCYVEQTLVRETKGSVAGETITQKRRIEGDRVIKDIIIQNNGATKTFYESVKMYSLKELEEAITDKGLAIKKTFGDFTGKEYLEHSSPRMIIIAQK
jgi:2-polyprenyl-3-methyl-5-hydroxy-6-metoxy-1,4-benzoquinol methylase